MKFPLTSLLVLVASVLTSAKPHKAPLLGPAGPQYSDTASCLREPWPSSGPLTFTNSYRINAQVNETGSRICGRLWHNLSRFPSCGAVTKAWCEDIGQEGTGKVLNWGFTVTSLCDSGAVHSCWFEATRNRYGPIGC
ncbi:hypothetical protein LX36DRAFT_651435 [Colletotrichum falcatum]|nr:hypothetical protein LX36DRAFT_651435 [Colletotrichum falcatum]